jgi:hypothetical protein
MKLKLPKILETDTGSPRRVGFELEFAGLELQDAAKIIKDLFGGEVVENHRYEFEVRNTDLGAFRIELDARVLRKMAERDVFEKLGFNIEQESFKNSIESFLDKAAKIIVPIEIVMPPVKIESISSLEQLRKKLQAHKAEGTKVSLMHMFGMHINIETPALNVETILKYLRAFLLLYPWLLQKLEIDISRKLSPFVDPFPKEYVFKVLDIDYMPSEKEFIVDYVKYNPTRNRPLDLLPILAMLDETIVESRLEGEKNRPRPTFHYRLPNSKIDDVNWTFTEEWNYWAAVEELAQKPEMIEKLAQLYVMRREKTLVSFKKEWVETIVILLDLYEN